MIKVIHVIGALELGGAEILVTDVQNNKPDLISSEIIYHTDGSLSKSISGKCTKLRFNRLNFRIIKHFRDHIKESETDIVHVHSVINPLMLIPILLFSKVKTVLTIHGYDLNNYKIIKSIAFRFFDKILFVSDTLKKDYLYGKKINDTKFDVVHNGINAEKFSVKSVSFKRRKEISDNTFLMGFVGNFNSVRDHYTVCKALKILNELDVEFLFLFIGSAQNRELYNKSYSYCEENGLLENVKFLGSRSDVPKILHTLDLFVYSSNNDTFGIAVVEAMMSGTPVVVNDLEVFKEITDNGKVAEIYETGDEKSLAWKINNLINDKKKREELSVLSKEWALKNYRIDKHINRLHHIYESLLSE